VSTEFLFYLPKFLKKNSRNREFPPNEDGLPVFTEREPKTPV
jgi:hypothetical protein